MTSDTIGLAKKMLSAVALFSLTFSQTAFAANKYWTGSGNGIWERAGNWSLTERGVGGAGIPDATDVAILGFSGGIVTLKSAVSVQGLVLRHLWTGSLLLGTGTLFIGTGGMRVGSGRFIGGNQAISINGNYAQTGGYVSAIMNNLTLSGSFSVTNGGGTGIPPPSFASTGTLIFDGAADQNFTVGANVSKSFHNLVLQNTGGGTSDDIVVNVNGGLTLSGELIVSLGNLDLATNSVPFVTESGIVLGASTDATFTTNSNMTVSGSIVSGAGSRFIVSSSSTLTLNGRDQFIDTNGSPFINVTVSSSSGTTLTSDLTVGGTLTVSAGSVLGLDTFRIYATGATIANLGLLHEDSGVIVHTGSTLLLADSSYAEKSDFGYELIFLTVTDSDENIDGTGLDTLTVSLSGGSDSETVTLTETAVSSGIFRNSISIIDLVAQVNDGVLALQSSTTISTGYTDAQDHFSLSDTATFTRPSSTTTSGGGGGGGGGGTRKAASVLKAITGISDAISVPKNTAVGGPGLPERSGKLLATVDGRSVVFKDVQVSQWFAPFIHSLISKAIISGYKDARGNPLGEFGPGRNVTYGEIAKMALNAAGISVDMRGTAKNRTAKGQWSAPYIAALEKLGVSTFAQGSVHVSDAAPRGAVVQTILEVFGKSIGSAGGDLYSDVKAGTLHGAAVEAATRDGIVSGDDGKTTFRPSASVNRAETAKIIQKAMETYGQ